MSQVMTNLLQWKESGKPIFDIADATLKSIKVPTSQIKEVKSGSAGFGSEVVVEATNGTRKVYFVVETPVMVEAAMNPSSDNNGALNEIALGLDATGSAQGAGVSVSKYFNTIDAATDTSAEAVDLPAAVKNGVLVIHNQTAVALEVFPASGEDVNGGAANAVYNQAANSIVFYYCKEDGSWLVLPVS